MEANDGVVQPLRGADPGGGEVEFQDCELSSPALDERGDKQSGTLVTPLSSRDLVQTTREGVGCLQQMKALSFTEILLCFRAKLRTSHIRLNWLIPTLAIYMCFFSS